LNRDEGEGISLRTSGKQNEVIIWKLRNIRFTTFMTETGVVLSQNILWQVFLLACASWRTDVYEKSGMAAGE